MVWVVSRQNWFTTGAAQLVRANQEAFPLMVFRVRSASSTWPAGRDESSPSSTIRVVTTVPEITCKNISSCSKTFLLSFFLKIICLSESYGQKQLCRQDHFHVTNQSILLITILTRSTRKFI